MKKHLLVALCCLLLCGCGSSWKKNFQVSEISTNTVEGLTTAVTKFNGTIKKIKNIIEEESIPIYNIDELEIGESKQFEYTLSKNYKGYDISVKDVTCY